MTIIDSDHSSQRDSADLTPRTTTGSSVSGAPPTTGLQSGPGAKVRILATASELFYHEGIRAVGVDRLISQSHVTKATFYKHFGAKESLVVRYIQARHDDIRGELIAIAAAARDPQSALRSMVDNIVAEAHGRQFRGCAFINAATEFPDSRSAVREAVSAHRDWYTAFVADLFRKHGAAMPGDAADEFVLLRDGALAGGYASDPIAASAALERCVERLLAACA